MASCRVYLTTGYHQTSPLPHSASFLPKHNQLNRSTREMRLVCKALKATFGKSQRPIISGKPTGTPYCMGHRGMAKFPRGSTWPTRLSLERDKTALRPSRVCQSMPEYATPPCREQLNSLCYAAQGYLVQSSYSIRTYLLLTTLHTFPRLLMVYSSIHVSFYAYDAPRVLSTFKIKPL